MRHMMWCCVSVTAPSSMAGWTVAALQELVQQILRLAPFGLANSFLGAPAVPADSPPHGIINGTPPANGVVQVILEPASEHGPAR